MKTLHLFALAILVLCNITAVCQSEPFVGEWQVGRNPKTKDTNITMTLVGSGKDLRGKMAFRNPDKTFTMAEIRNVSVKGATLEFETLDGGEPLHWSLAVQKDGTTAVLKGHHHEMIIEEKAYKRCF